MGYQKINVEVIVFSEDAGAVADELNLALDRLEETYTIFGGDIENVAVAHSGTRRKSALRHTFNAGKTVTSALKSVVQDLADTYKKVI
jgi:hypothetical protein